MNRDLENEPVLALLFLRITSYFLLLTSHLSLVFQKKDSHLHDV